MLLNIIHHRNIFFIISGTLIIASVASLFLWGLNLNIDFTGGTLVEVSFINQRPATLDVSELLSGLNFSDAQIQSAGESELILRMRSLSEVEHQLLLGGLQDKFGADNIVENRFESVGPIIGQELRSKAWIAILLSLLFIVAYVAYSFRHVSKPVASWKYGIAAVIALFHDIIIVTGIFSMMGHFWGTEIGILFVTALLTILGYSINDTIVVFDRIRENLIYRPKDTFLETINHSVNETIIRSINTSFTVLLVLVALYVFGGTTVRDFVLALIFGIIFGTYSSIFIASPMLIIWQKLSSKKY